MENTRKLFIENITGLRTGLRMTQSEVAEAIGVTTGTYQKYEYGTAFPSPDKVDDLARVLGVPIADLYLDKNSMLYRPQSVDRPTLILELYDIIREMSLDDLETLKFTAKGLLAQSDASRTKSSKGS